MPAFVGHASSVSYEHLLTNTAPPTCLRRGVWWFYNAVLTALAVAPLGALHCRCYP